LCGKACLQGLAHLILVAVSLGAIEVSKAGFECASGGAYCHGGIGNQGAEAEHGYLAGSVRERQSLRPQIRRFDHDESSAEGGVQQEGPKMRRSSDPFHVEITPAGVVG
jgi:hypothetical protein